MSDLDKVFSYFICSFDCVRLVENAVLKFKGNMLSFTATLLERVFEGEIEMKLLKQKTNFVRMFLPSARLATCRE